MKLGLCGLAGAAAGLLPGCGERPAAAGLLAAGSLPEMISDLIDESAVDAVENVRRDRSGRSGLVGRGGPAGWCESRP